MFHYSIFAAADGDLPSKGFTALTLCGFSRLRQPTLAQRIQDRQRIRTRKRSWLERISGSDRGTVLTVFGITEIVEPTLVEEYAALRSLVASGAIAPDAIRAVLDDVGARDDWVAMTLVGICTRSKASRQKQVKALDSAEKSGLIPQNHRQQLDGLIGSPTTAAAGVLGRLATAPA